MTLDELKANLTDSGKTFADAYGEQVLALAATDATNFITLLAAGNQDAAYSLLCSKMTGVAALADAQAQTAALNAANSNNAASIALQKKALTIFLGGILALVAASVGL
jgi:hypothetical protein